MKAVPAQGKACDLATKAVEARGNGSVLAAKAVEAHNTSQGGSTKAQRQWKHKAKAVETQGKRRLKHRAQRQWKHKARAVS